MKIIHTSDSHGTFLTLPAVVNDNYDPVTVIHTGDLLPNRTRGIVMVERAYQEQWLYDNEKRIKHYFGDYRVLLTPGNHDYIDPCPILRQFGIDAHNLHEEGPATVGDYTVVGFPFVNEFTREWNFEVDKPTMQWKISTLLAPHFTDDRKTILASHGPIYGVLDRNFEGNRCGSRELKVFLETCPYPPVAALWGHIHEAAGKVGWSRGIQVYNSARTAQVLTLQ